MVFSSVSFLFVFLPALLLVYFLIPSKYRSGRNLVLLIFSLFFYAYGGPRFLILMLVSIALNYVGGLLCAPSFQWRRAALWITVAINLGLLGWFKYATFLAENLSKLWTGLPVPEITLPIGISFFTFQGMSYVLDVYRGDAQAERNPLRIALYISLFPQLVAGPIVRYTTVAAELRQRRETLEDFSDGAVRFLFGLAKKMLLANSLGLIADDVFALAPQTLSVSLAWLGALAYTGQIYFDFSGYSDMAVGLGLLFGIRLPENFSAPFLSRSIEEYWRRWHISLGDWLKNYLFYPLLRTKFFMNLPKKLKGKLGKKGAKQATTFLAMLILWFTIGYWHGGAWTFIIGCGLLHWFYIVSGKLMEPLFVKWRAFFHIEKEKKGFILFQRVRTFFLVMIGLVFFRSATVPDALRVLGRGVSGLGLQLFRNGVLSGLGLDWTELMILAVSILFSAWVTIHNQKEDMRVTLEKKPIWLRWIALYALLFYVILLGKYGPGYSASEFIYQNFKV